MTALGLARLLLVVLRRSFLSASCTLPPTVSIYALQQRELGHHALCGVLSVAMTISMFVYASAKSPFRVRKRIALRVFPALAATILSARYHSCARPVRVGSVQAPPARARPMAPGRPKAAKRSAAIALQCVSNSMAQTGPETDAQEHSETKMAIICTQSIVLRLLAQVPECCICRKNIFDVVLVSCRHMTCEWCISKCI